MAGTNKRNKLISNGPSIILKNPQDLILEDLNLLIINHFDIQKLK